MSICTFTIVLDPPLSYSTTFPVMTACSMSRAAPAGIATTTGLHVAVFTFAGVYSPGSPPPVHGNKVAESAETCCPVLGFWYGLPVNHFLNALSGACVGLSQSRPLIVLWCCSGETRSIQAHLVAPIALHCASVNGVPLPSCEPQISSGVSLQLLVTEAEQGTVAPAGLLKLTLHQ